MRCKPAKLCSLFTIYRFHIHIVSICIISLLLRLLFILFFCSVFNSVSHEEAFYLSLSLCLSGYRKFALQIPFTVAAQAQTPATRARRSNVRVTGPVLVCDSVQSRSVVEGTVGRDETLFDASGPLEFLSSDALMSGVISSRNGSRGTTYVTAEPSVEFDR